MAPAELIGGPEDGRQLCMLGPDEAPMDRFVLPARIAVDEGPTDSELPPLLRYDRGERRPDGCWCYHFAGTEPMSASPEIP